MKALERIRDRLQGMPDGTLVPVAWLLAELREGEDEGEAPLGVEQVAERLAISASSVRGLCRAGELPAFKLGRAWRVTPEALDGYVRALQDRAATPSSTPLRLEGGGRLGAWRRTAKGRGAA